MIERGHLNHFRDTATQCYSNITLPDGTPVFVSIARTGVKVKKSKFGILGKHYFSGDVQSSAVLAQKLNEKFGVPSWLPDDMTNPVLRQLTAVALSVADEASLYESLGTASK